MDFTKELNRKINLINDSLEKYLSPQYPEKIYDAMRYSVLSGGKRIRPVLLLSICEFFGGDIEKALPFAAALEMIHAYSLIHDDLPAMDNDDYRRGQLTNHKVFGEAFAILAGDGLLNKAYEIMAEYCFKNFEINNIRAMNIIAKASGIMGMIGGQTADIEFENKNADERALLYIHRNKTGALFQAVAAAGACIAAAGEDDIEKFLSLGEKIGVAFQIKDDILDITSEFKKLGKNVFSDEKNKKTTYVSMYGLEKAENDFQALSNEILDIIRSFGPGTGFLLELAEKLMCREH